LRTSSPRKALASSEGKSLGGGSGGLQAGFEVVSEVEQDLLFD
jgi:hypothetical protein